MIITSSWDTCKENEEGDEMFTNVEYYSYFSSF